MKQSRQGDHVDDGPKTLIDVENMKSQFMMSTASSLLKSLKSWLMEILIFYLDYLSLES